MRYYCKGLKITNKMERNFTNGKFVLLTVLLSIKITLQIDFLLIYQFFFFIANLVIN